MTLDDLAALEKEAAPGNWGRAFHNPLIVRTGNLDWIDTDGNGNICRCDHLHDVAFIAAIRNAAPILLQIARAADGLLSTDMHPEDHLAILKYRGLREALTRLEGVGK